MHYSDLVQLLQKLETKWAGNQCRPLPSTASARLIVPPPYENVQYFVCDNTTLGRDLPVVIAVGVNYSQLYFNHKEGAVRKPVQFRLPDRSGKQAATAPPWVEEDLSKRSPNKPNLIKQFNDYNNRPSVWFDQCWASSPQIRNVPKDVGEFHLVETNFCPWITIDEWGSTFHSEPLRADILVTPPTQPFPICLFQHIKDLKQEIGDVLWVGHGVDAVSTLFRLFAYTENIRAWLIVYNLMGFRLAKPRPDAPPLPVHKGITSLTVEE
jgi:hypothetical protein